MEDSLGDVFCRRASLRFCDCLAYKWVWKCTDLADTGGEIRHRGGIYPINEGGYFRIIITNSRHSGLRPRRVF